MIQVGDELKAKIIFHLDKCRLMVLTNLVIGKAGEDIVVIQNMCREIFF